MYVWYIHAPAADAAVIAQKPNQAHRLHPVQQHGQQGGRRTAAAHRAAALAAIRPDAGLAHPASHAASTTRIAPGLGLDFGRGGSASWKPDRSLAAANAKGGSPGFGALFLLQGPLGWAWRGCGVLDEEISAGRIRSYVSTAMYRRVHAVKRCGSSTARVANTADSAKHGRKRRLPPKPPKAPKKPPFLLTHGPAANRRGCMTPTQPTSSPPAALQHHGRGWAPEAPRAPP
ncbi:uncharacterized protein TrAFT101_011370 [Trichoderma asperellum]|uniref:Uncharacterized protein n=1 Tax=Trichoderma asperellum (strain ATCC 204424 / CBS 433.97 / NBRC 101777) TaxID=1042311 RepID=A0A2T3YRU1_TRIA4|nr:hypothetical protein M441DRAFT_74395 [Trichoderma asperellum CBS 433.97]PTB35285.1 hypothetical protein M441DRAFT_74395 [Trichoderma asperellum CBS 433.97]UKZ96590.1 hypothetical protein TrAFT101_011370 [Trichoderma asperellum]